jgi:hypothetical protein
MGGCFGWDMDGGGSGGGGSSFVTPAASAFSIQDGAAAPATGDGVVKVTYTPFLPLVMDGCTPTPPVGGFVGCT